MVLRTGECGEGGLVWEGVLSVGMDGWVWEGELEGRGLWDVDG